MPRAYITYDRNTLSDLELCTLELALEPKGYMLLNPCDPGTFIMFAHVTSDTDRATLVNAWNIT